MCRRIAIIITMFFLCLGIYTCSSPEEPEPNYEYRYNVEVIYTRTSVDYPNRSDEVRLFYSLLDFEIPGFSSKDSGVKEMNKIGKDRFRCYLDKVYIQNENHMGLKHTVYVSDSRLNDGTGEGIDVQGMYGAEIRYGSILVDFSRLYFLMSKE